MKDVHLALDLRLVHQVVEGDEGASSTNAGAAVNDRRTDRRVVKAAHLFAEGEQRRWVARHAVVWPRREMELANSSRRVVLNDKQFN